MGIACQEPPDPRRTNFKIDRPGVTAEYDNKSGRLKRMDADLDKDGRVETFSYWDGTTLQRIEIDRDGDGKIDRWEHYGAGNAMVSVGTSSAGDGVEDTWSYADAGLLAKVESDTNRDGVVDKRETFGPGNASPSQRVLRTVELDIDNSGRPAVRLWYRPDGSFERSEKVR